MGFRQKNLFCFFLQIQWEDLRFLISKYNREKLIFAKTFFENFKAHRFWVKETINFSVK
jgi:hypothetical protein